MNDAIGCFLGPAGMVYAIFFGFTYQAVTERLDSIARLVAAEAAQCFTILHITYSIPIENMPVAVKLHIARSVHKSLVELVEQVFDNGNIPGSAEDFLPGLQQILPDLYKLDKMVQEQDESSKSKLLQSSVKLLFNSVVQNDKSVHDRRTAQRQSLSQTEWAFLMALRCCAFFGIMLVDAKSPAMNLALCYITCFWPTASDTMIAGKLAKPAIHRSCMTMCPSVCVDQNVKCPPKNKCTNK